MIAMYRVTLCSVAWIGLAALSIHAQVPADQIPPVHATALTGEKIDLPSGLNGRVGVLVIGFSQGSRDAVAGWGKRLAGEYRASTTVIYYEMPLLESVPGLLRGYVVRKIGESIPDAGKSRFVPVLDHEKDWKRLTGYKGGDAAYVVVVESSGAVRCKLQGPASDANFAELKRQVASAH